MRSCFDCGATSDEAKFAGTRKPSRRRDRCTDCALDPGGVGWLRRVVTRREAIAALRAAGLWRIAKPVHTLPLFTSLGGPCGRPLWEVLWEALNDS